MLKKITSTVVGILLVFSAVAFAIKAGVGVLPVDAAMASISEVIHMKVGTFSMLFQTCYFIGQIMIEKKNFRKTEFLQILYITLGGSVLNFILYTVLRDITFTAYPIRLLVCVASFAVSSFGCSMVLEAHLMRTPMEGLLILLAERMGTTMGKIRQKMDIILVILCLILTFVCGAKLQIREGTVIAALVFGPMFDFWKKYVFK